MERRHDIDALRALAFGLLILYHVGMYYVAGWPWHLKSPYQGEWAEWLRWPMRFVNIWRMDLIFLVSGIALGFLRAKQAPARLFAQRSARLLVPLGFGMAVVVPIQPYLQGVANGLVEPGFAQFLARYYTGGPWPAGAFDGWQFGVTWNHLWYLPYLWAYTAALLALLPLLESAPGKRLRERFAGLRGAALLIVPALAPIAYALLLQRKFPPTHDLVADWYLHALYFTLFLYGTWIGTDRGFWGEAARLRHRALALAFALFAANAALGGSAILRNLYLWSAILAVLGYAHAHLNRPFRWLEWANESVYPWYLLHQSLIVALAFALAPLALGPIAEPVLLAAGTLAGCWLINDALVRRTRWLRPLFGLKRAPESARPWLANVRNLPRSLG